MSYADDLLTLAVTEGFRDAVKEHWDDILDAVQEGVRVAVTEWLDCRHAEELRATLDAALARVAEAKQEDR